MFTSGCRTYIDNGSERVKEIIKIRLPRIMIAATSSGSGKTMITCGILQALINRGLAVASFKAGPDYIDPMFHSKVIGTKSKNLDTFFTDERTTKFLFGKTAKGVELSVIEGVMGFYDGLGVTSTKASSCELSHITQTPVILIVNCQGMSLSTLAVVQGFLAYKRDNQIQGILLNQVSEGLYLELKKKIEKELQVVVLGYIPQVKNLQISSRHLGLITPEEVNGFRVKINKLADIIEKTVQIDKIIEIAKNASWFKYEEIKVPRIARTSRIAIAKDKAFCFYYEDNLQVLKDMGAQLIEFSPLEDSRLPNNINGLLLGGGYPELYAKKLSENVTMRRSIKEALGNGMTCMAECGGFMYLHQTMEDMEGKKFPMVGWVDGDIYKTDKLLRFGYITLSVNQDQMLGKQGEIIRGHEFHYFESSALGDGFLAKKPSGKAEWNCIHGNEQMAVGFPHLYYYSNLRIPYRFLEKSLESEKV
jgi:cobyrinic acid a,c-diamide synthase